MSDLKIEIPPGAAAIIKRLTESGFRADIVGGCVRDALLGRVADDFDITTSASPTQMLEIFSDMRVIETGIAHGTVTVIVDGRPYEVTAYRIDGEYTDARHPDSVTFTTKIEDDLSRRDFTVNAMAYSDAHGLTDIFGGRSDLEERLIRAVGCPEKRFGEDALRILRALRFSSVLSFEIEEKTAAAVRSCKNLLDNVSKERIYIEWVKLIGGVRAYDVIEKFFDVVEIFIPELSCRKLPPREGFDAASASARMLALFAANLGEGAEDAFKRATYRLKTDRHTRECGCAVLENLAVSIETKTDVLRLLSRIGEECVGLLISVRKVIGTADDSDEEKLIELLRSNSVFKVSGLAVDGSDLIALGLRGADIGAALSELLDLVISERLENNREELLSYLKVKSK